MNFTVTRLKKGSRRKSYMEVDPCYATVFACGPKHIEDNSMLVFGSTADSTKQEESVTVVLTRLELQHVYNLIKARLEEMPADIERVWPAFIRFGENGSAMRLMKPEQGYPRYWRDAGNWGVDARYDKNDGKFYSIFHEKGSLNDVELIPITKVEWKKSNAGYV